MRNRPDRRSRPARREIARPRDAERAQADRRVRPRGQFPRLERALVLRRLLVNFRCEGEGMTVETVGRDVAVARMVTLPARPEPIRVAVDETAVIVIDMQNAYASPGGYLDLAGFDIA